MCTLTDAPSVRVRRGQTAAPTTAGVRTLHRTRTSVTSGEFFDTVRYLCLEACCFFAWKQKWTFCIGAVVADARSTFSIGPAADARCTFSIGPVADAPCIFCRRPLVADASVYFLLALCCRSPEQILYWPYVADAQCTVRIGPAVADAQCIFCIGSVVAKIRVWSCLVNDNLGLFTEIAVCKFLRGWRMSRNLFILSIVCVYTFFCSFLYGALCPRSC